MMPMKNLITTAVAAFLLSGPTFGALTFTITEVGSDVVVNGLGSVDTSVLTQGSGRNSIGVINPSGVVELYMGDNNYGPVDIYEVVFTGPAVFGSGGANLADSGTGDRFGFGILVDSIAVPQGYSSGDSLSGSMTFSNTDLASLGVTPGNYVWTWGSGPNADSMTLNAVPEPSNYAALLAFSALWLAVWRRGKR